MSNFQKKTKIIIAICSLFLLVSVVLGTAFFMKKPHADSPNQENDTEQVTSDFSSIKRDTTMQSKNFGTSMADVFVSKTPWNNVLSINIISTFIQFI